MSRTLNLWINPDTSLQNLGAAVDRAKELAASVSSATRPWHPALIVPSNYGPWPQSECTHSLPDDLTIGTPEDVARMRARIEEQGVGFGVHFVPVNLDDERAPGVGIPELCAGFAAAAGFAVANFEPGPDYWAPGDDGGALDKFWARFWAALPDAEAMKSSVAVTLVPSAWGIEAFGGTLGRMMGGGATQSATNYVGGATTLILETFGGPSTSEYGFDMWPVSSFNAIYGSVPFGRLDLAAPGTRIVPMLSLANLQSQAHIAGKLGHGTVHVWSI